MSFIVSFIEESLKMFVQAAPYITLGILIGGFLKVFIKDEWIKKYLGGNGLSPVLRASIIGIPLPLCSCGVIPAAAGLKKQGASSNSIVSFLISTPESGIDSISISYALLDPILTVARPIIAFISAFVAGTVSTFIGGKDVDSNQIELEHHNHHHEKEKPENMADRIKLGIHFAINDIWGDLAKAFFIGIVLSGLISTLVPPAFLERYLGGGIGSMFIMLIVGVPMYICASSSTPLAAALILKGISPGAALVFLMAGPATNISALPVLKKVLGTKRLIIYLTSIAIVSITSGLLVDHIYKLLSLSPVATIGSQSEVLPQWLHISTAILLFSLWLFREIKKRTGQVGTSNTEPST